MCPRAVRFCGQQCESLAAAQTRTRVYMFAFDKTNDDRVHEWKDMMKEFERPASASLEVRGPFFSPCLSLSSLSFCFHFPSVHFVSSFFLSFFLSFNVPCLDLCVCARARACTGVFVFAGLPPPL